MERKLALDVDAILYPLLPAMHKLPGGERVCYADCHEWDTLIELSGGKEAMLDLFHRAMTFEYMQTIGLVEGAKAGVERLVEAGIEIHIMTSRPAIRCEDTKRFLQAQGISYHAFDCAWGLDKVTLCQERSIPLIVDDHPETLEAANGAGISGMTLGYLYNSSVCEKYELFHAKDWRELGQAILEFYDSRKISVAK